MKKTIGLALLIFALVPAAFAQSAQGFNPGPFYVRPFKNQTPPGSAPRFVSPQGKTQAPHFPIVPAPITTRDMGTTRKVSPMVITPDRSRSFR